MILDGDRRLLWVMAHLFWDPRQDVWGLVRDFRDGYHGKAGADICDSDSGGRPPNPS